MVVLVLCTETNELTKQKETIVSHGVDMNTLKNVTLPPVSPQSIGYFSRTYGEWILK